jgi:D-cysteine desulfhydrase
MIPYPPRVPLAHIPTPLDQLRRLGLDLGLELYMKRDDLTGSALTGNKVRKLEYLLADAVTRGADTVLTCGGAQSNHCRATAIAAARLGLKTRLLLRVPDPLRPPALEGNILLDRVVGAEIVWITRDEYRRRGELFVRMSAELADMGRRPYVIPEGGSKALGAWGYVRCMEELAADLAALGPPRTTTIVYAAGSGGTGAGLIVGARMLGLDVRVVGFNVCDDRAYFVNAIGQIVEDMIRTHSLEVGFARDRDVEIIDGYVGGGYAVPCAPTSSSSSCRSRAGRASSSTRCTPARPSTAWSASSARTRGPSASASSSCTPAGSSGSSPRRGSWSRCSARDSGRPASSPSMEESASSSAKPVRERRSNMSRPAARCAYGETGAQS